MAGAKLVVLYPAPRDPAQFERAYTAEHAPMVTPKNFPGLTKFVASKITGTADGSPAPFARIAELHFPSLQALQAAAGGEPAKQAVAHAISISTGGPPIFLIAEEQTSSF
ncbi:MAG TPA: EthD family reductase [Gemmatimonadales bacterium]|nr:EthD family reductase [Gemmatimonadales bacterium]